MREQQFIMENEKRWKELEAHLNGLNNLSGDKLADAYIAVTDDLAFARSTYPQSTIVAYLNDLSSRFHTALYRHKEQTGSMKQFWVTDLPLVLHDAFPAFRISLFVFLMSILIGAFSTYQNPEFARQIMGDEYMDITEQNIKKGDPMAIYKAQQQVSMFAMIGINNVRVALFAFAAGLFTSFFTAFILISNGIMVGCFQYYFISKGLGWISFSTIFLHGALELSCIVICGGAGIVLGNSWLFPGTYSRMTALVEQSKKGIKIMMGATPVIIMAALLESFVTRHYLELSSFTRLFLIIGSFLFILGYFVIYPKMVFTMKNNLNARL